MHPYLSTSYLTKKIKKFLIPRRETARAETNGDIFVVDLLV